MLHSLQSTLTANQATLSRHYLVDASQIGAGVQVHRLKWLCMVTGPAALSAARVEAFDTATGTYKLDRPLPISAQSGNVYRLWSKGNVWPDVSAAEAAAGHTRYRCIFFRQEHGVVGLTALRFYFRDLSAGGGDFHRTHRSSGLGPSAFISRANDTTDIFDSIGSRDPMGGADNMDGCTAWQNPFGYGVADSQIDALTNNPGGVPIWLRHRIPAGGGFRRSVAMQLVAQSTLGGLDPDPFASSVILPFDVAADADQPEGELEPDRWVHVGGGARLRGRVTRGAGPEANRVVRWVLRPGDLGSIHTDDEPFAGSDRTDADGITAATYRAPELELAAGLTAAPRLLIGAGDELGDPQPRISLVGLIDFGQDAGGDLTLPSSSQSYDEDPGLGLGPTHG